MQRNTGDTESITIEYGFLDSKKDDVNQLKNNWKTYAEAAVQGILNYIQGNNIQNGYHVVKAGESLYSIAQKYNTTVEELKRLNNLTSNNLSVGQRLKIPMSSMNMTDNYYTVKAGDTLYSIANRYNTTVSELKRINNLNSDELYIGQKLLVNNKLDNTMDNNDDNIYIVKLGDTLYSIAKKYGVSVMDLANINNIDDNIVVIGQELIIPNNNTSNNIYTVKAGDTLYSIARKYNLSVNELIQMNNLTNNLLSIGQQLKV